MEPVKIFLTPCGMSFACTCAVSRNEAGEIVLPDLGACAFTIHAHSAAIKRALEIIEGVKPQYPEVKP